MLIKEPKNISLRVTSVTQKHLRKFFGKTISDTKLAALVGALDESIIEITPLGEGFISETKHRFLIEQTRIGGSHEQFGLFITNEFFQLNGDAPAGIGLISFVRQVMAARELNFAFIRTYAEGFLDDPDGFIGYYVWARFGFNAPLSDREVSQLPAEYQGCLDLNDLMLRGGHEWWRQNGSARDMIFLLSDDELSLEVLRNYLEEKEVQANL